MHVVSPTVSPHSKEEANVCYLSHGEIKQTQGCGHLEGEGEAIKGFTIARINVPFG